MVKNSILILHHFQDCGNPTKTEFITESPCIINSNNSNEKVSNLQGEMSFKCLPLSVFSGPGYTQKNIPSSVCDFANPISFYNFIKLLISQSLFFLFFGESFVFISL